MNPYLCIESALSLPLRRREYYATAARVELALHCTTNRHFTIKLSRLLAAWIEHATPCFSGKCSTTELRQLYTPGRTRTYNSFIMSEKFYQLNYRCNYRGGRIRTSKKIRAWAWVTTSFLPLRPVGYEPTTFFKRKILYF